MKRINKEAVNQVCMFLKLLWEQTSNQESIISMQSMAMKLEVPYARNITHILREKGIVEARVTNGKGKVYSYKWISTTEPNINMAKAILIECRNLSLKYSTVSLPSQAILNQATMAEAEYEAKIWPSDYKISGTIQQLAEKHPNECSWRHIVIMARRNKADNHIFNIESYNGITMVY
jgi:hypothetical protein